MGVCSNKMGVCSDKMGVCSDIMGVCSDKMGVCSEHLFCHSDEVHWPAPAEGTSPWLLRLVPSPRDGESQSSQSQRQKGWVVRVCNRCGPALLGCPTP